MPRIAGPLNPKYFTAFSLYALLLAILGALLIEFGKESDYWSPFWWTIVAAALFVSANVIYDTRLRKLIYPKLSPLALNPQLAGVRARVLVVLISREPGASSARWAIQWHLEALERVWLIASDDSKQQADDLKSWLDQHKPAVQVFRETLSNVHSIGVAKALVEDILRRAHNAGFKYQNIVCDLTGMTKSVSAGMLLASVRSGGRLTVMEPEQLLENGRPDPAGRSVPIEITQSETSEDD